MRRADRFPPDCRESRDLEPIPVHISETATHCFSILSPILKIAECGWNPEKYNANCSLWNISRNIARHPILRTGFLSIFPAVFPSEIPAENHGNRNEPCGIPQCRKLFDLPRSPIQRAAGNSTATTAGFPQPCLLRRSSTGRHPSRPPRRRK